MLDEELEDFVQNKFGYCFYEVYGTTTLIYNLYVYPEYRQQGKAKMLIRHVINEIRGAGCTGEIMVQCCPKGGIDPEKLKSFYERMGLKIIS